MLKAYKQVPIGNPLDGRHADGAALNDQAVEEDTCAIEQAGGEGGNVLYGGKRGADPGGQYVEPRSSGCRSRVRLSRTRPSRRSCT